MKIDSGLSGLYTVNHSSPKATSHLMTANATLKALSGRRRSLASLNMEMSPFRQHRPWWWSLFHSCLQDLDQLSGVLWLYQRPVLPWFSLMHAHMAMPLLWCLERDTLPMGRCQVQWLVWQTTILHLPAFLDRRVVSVDCVPSHSKMDTACHVGLVRGFQDVHARAHQFNAFGYLDVPNTLHRYSAKIRRKKKVELGIPQALPRWLVSVPSHAETDTARHVRLLTLRKLVRGFQDVHARAIKWIVLFLVPSFGRHPGDFPSQAVLQSA